MGAKLCSASCRSPHAWCDRQWQVCDCAHEEAGHEAGGSSGADQAAPHLLLQDRDREHTAAQGII
jgi:hypothetical protein